MSELFTHSTTQKFADGVSPRRGCDENKLEELQNDCHTKKFLMKGGLYKAVSEDWMGRFR